MHKLVTSESGVCSAEDKFAVGYLFGIAPTSTLRLVYFNVSYSTEFGILVAFCIQGGDWLIVIAGWSWLARTMLGAVGAPGSGGGGRGLRGAFLY